VVALITWTFGPNGATQKRTADIETAVGVTDHPAFFPASRIMWPLLGFDQQGNRRDLISTMTEPVSMTPLQHQKRR